MIKLLYADLARIFKSRFFRAGLIITAAFAVCTVLMIKKGNGMLSYAPAEVLVLLPILMAAFTGLTVSSEFTYGTIRNKIIIGHSRVHIYSASLISLCAAALIYYAVYEIIVFSLGTAVLDTSGVSLKATAAILLIMPVMIISNTALSLFICMLVRDSKSIALTMALQYALMLFDVLKEIFKNSIVIKILGKSIPQGYIYALDVYEMPTEPLLAICCPLLLGVVVTVFGMLSLEKSNLN